MKHKNILDFFILATAFFFLMDHGVPDALLALIKILACIFYFCNTFHKHN